MAEVLISSAVDEQYAIDDSKMDVAGICMAADGSLTTFTLAGFVILWYHPSGAPYP